jgi:hypothetical protein
MKGLTRNLRDNLAELTVKIGYPDSDIKFNYPKSCLKGLFGDRQMTDDALYSYLDSYFEENRNQLPECGYRSGKEMIVITLSQAGAVSLLNERSGSELVSRLCLAVTESVASKEEIHEIFLCASDSARIIPFDGLDFDELIYTPDGTDPYFYLFSYEPTHTEYHRFLPDDFREIYNDVNI